MEPVEPPKRSGLVKFLTLAVALAVMAAILGSLLGIVLWHARGAVGPLRSWMIRFAVLCVAMLGLTLVVLFWLVIRFLAARVRTTLPTSRTQHVDAWKLAGRRVQVPDDEPAEGEDSEDQNRPG